MEYALGHFNFVKKESSQRKKPCPTCGSLTSVSQRVCKSCNHIFYEVKQKKAPRGFAEVNWKELEVNQEVFILSSDIWTSPSGERIMMGETGLYKVVRLTHQGILAYGESGFAFFDMISEGVGRSGIKRGITKTYKRDFNKKKARRQKL